jgi:ABC-2 type transport system permease protein
MKTLWDIAAKDLLQVLKDRNSLILLLAIPLILIVVVGFALGNVFGTGSTQITINVAVSNQDTDQNAYVGKAILSALKINTSRLAVTVDEYGSTGQVTQQVTNSNNAALVGVVIPSGASATLITDTQQGITPKNLVQIYTLPNNSDARIPIVENIVSNVVSAQLVGSEAIGQVQKVCSNPGNHCVQSSINPVAINTAITNTSEQASQSVRVLTAGQAVKIGQFDQIVPGYAIFFSLFGLNAAAATILQEKEDGTFRRLLIAPIQKYALLGGKLLAQFILTMAQLLIIFLFGYFVLKMHIGSWPTIILLLIGTSFATTGLGILLVSVIKTRRQLNPIVTLVTLITAAIGGSWWPLFLEPVWMQQIAKLGIVAWAMEGINNTMIYGKDFQVVLPDILGLLAYGAICFVIALRLFRFQGNAA